MDLRYSDDELAFRHDVACVQLAQQIAKRGLLVSRVVIPRPVPELYNELI